MATRNLIQKHFPAGQKHTRHNNRKPKNSLFSLWFFKLMYNQNITNILTNKWEIEFQCPLCPHHTQDVPL